MNEIVFKPKHNWFSIVFLGLLIISLGGAALVVGYVTGDNAILVLGVLFVLMGLYSIGRRSTLIVIGNAEVEMKRLFLPTVALDYENFTDFTGAAFMFGNKGIPLDDMTNAQEFVEIFAPVLEGQKVRSTGKYVADVNRTNKPFSKSSFSRRRVWPSVTRCCLPPLWKTAYIVNSVQITPAR